MVSPLIVTTLRFCQASWIVPSFSFFSKKPLLSIVAAKRSNRSIENRACLMTGACTTKFSVLALRNLAVPSRRKVTELEPPCPVVYATSPALDNVISRISCLRVEQLGKIDTKINNAIIRYLRIG